MEIVEALYTEQIKMSFRIYYDENYDNGKDWFKENYDGADWDDFKYSAIEELYNSDKSEPFCETYSHLVYFLKVVKENDEDYGGCFKDWDNPQKVFELGMYFLARNVLSDEEYEDYKFEYESEEEEDERYCDNADCPYEGFCCLEVLEEHKGKPYICKGCSTGIGVQEEDLTP